MALIEAKFESSVLPPFNYSFGEEPGEEGAPPAEPNPISGIVDAIKKFILNLARPKVTVSSDLLGTKVYAPNGEPFPWQIGFILMLLGVAYIGHSLWALGRRIAR